MGGSEAVPCRLERMLRPCAAFLLAVQVAGAPRVFKIVGSALAPACLLVVSVHGSSIGSWCGLMSLSPGSLGAPRCWRLASGFSQQTLSRVHMARHSSCDKCGIGGHGIIRSRPAIKETQSTSCGLMAMDCSTLVHACHCRHAPHLCARKSGTVSRIRAHSDTRADHASAKLRPRWRGERSGLCAPRAAHAVCGRARAPSPRRRGGGWGGGSQVPQRRNVCKCLPTGSATLKRRISLRQPLKLAFGFANFSKKRFHVCQFRAWRRSKIRVLVIGELFICVLTEIVLDVLKRIK